MIFNTFKTPMPTKKETKQYEYVSREDLRNLPLNKEAAFILPSMNKVESAKTTCNQMKLYGMKFTLRKHIDLEKNTYVLYVTRLK